ncbi:hypothetical protein Y032_0012g1892 [Ancylostoma ceylanicum]|uniref:N-terminal methionine N(alpha)-acetyltransferase NatE n=3 Tax=Ancylostoma ceylanicum TaxID=53326 RepID=A0A016VDD3_9BILA|nr:hypothetical protein Y032_0012g1892 [Ancylostoma ceylanicum]
MFSMYSTLLYRHPSMSLCNIDKDNLRSVKNLHAGVFPVQYSDAFFQKVLNNELCAAVMLNGECIGVVCCTFEIVACTKTLYIMSLAVHPLYRCRGIGAMLLDFAIAKAESHRVPLVRLHVQVSNGSAIQFYQKRGFVIAETTKNYYNRCIPADAYVMQKQLQA